MGCLTRSLIALAVAGLFRFTTHNHIFCVLTSQCRNWDGGYQEYETAASCIEAVFPGSPIVPNRVDTYPIRVSVTVNGSNTPIWSGRQQDLFRKYAAKRNQCVQEITTKLRQFQDTMINDKA